jgi:hypothetical protein
MRINLSPDRVLSADFFDGFVFRFIQNVCLQEGEEESGLGNYYGVRLKNHIGGLQDYEGAVFYYLNQAVPAARCIVHVGIGIGTTTALLAATGRNVVGVEWDQQRFRLATQLRQATMTVWPDVQKRYQLVAGGYPSVNDDLSKNQGPDCVLLFTNFAGPRPDEFRDSIIATFIHFGHVVLDLRTFCGTLEEEAQRCDLRDRILAAGMKEIGPIRTSPGNYYHHFAR